jgi:hypothetical protein
MLGAQGMRLSPILLSTVFVFLNLGGVALAQSEPPPPVGSGADRDTFDPASRTGRKCYVVTRDDIRYGESPGIDPATGRECRPVTAEVIERLRAYKWGNRPQRIESTDPIFFSLRTGEPIVWYHKDENDLGFDPGTGDELVPITKEMVALWRDQEKKRKEDEGRRKKDEARRAPQLMVSGCEPVQEECAAAQDKGRRSCSAVVGRDIIDERHRRIDELLVGEPAQHCAMATSCCSTAPGNVSDLIPAKEGARANKIADFLQTRLALVRDP